MNFRCADESDDVYEASTDSDFEKDFETEKLDKLESNHRDSETVSLHASVPLDFEVESKILKDLIGNTVDHAVSYECKEEIIETESMGKESKLAITNQVNENTAESDSDISQQSEHSFLDELSDEDSGVPRTFNELNISSVPIDPVPVDFLPAEMNMHEAGIIAAVVGEMVTVQAATVSKALDLGSVLWMQDRKPLGRIDDLFGPVMSPFYAVRFASVNEAAVWKLQLKEKVYFSQEFASFVLPASIHNKGSDASAKHDEEPAEDELDFSDDEKEAEHKRMLKLKRAAALGQNIANPLRSATTSVPKKRHPKKISNAAAPIPAFNPAFAPNSQFQTIPIYQVGSTFPVYSQPPPGFIPMGNFAASFPSYYNSNHASTLPQNPAFFVPQPAIIHSTPNDNVVKGSEALNMLEGYE